MRKHLKMLLGYLLTIAIVLTDLPIVTKAAEEVGIDTSLPTVEEQLSSEEVYAVAEVEEERTESSKTFRMSDGSYTLAKYNSPIHYEKEGVWEDVDNSLEGSDDVYDTVAGRFDVKFAKKSNSQFLMKLKREDMAVSWSVVSPKKNKVTGVANHYTNETDSPMSLTNIGSEMIYENIFEDIDLQYIITPTGVKENIIVNKSQDNYKYTFELKVKGVTLQLKEDGSIHVCDEAGEERFIIPAPNMSDATGVYSEQVHYELSSSGNEKKYTLSIVADETWINADEREFPVTIDPMFIETGHDVIHDTVGSFNSKISDLSPTILKVGWKDRELASYIHTDLDIQGKRIVDARLRMYYNTYAYSIPGAVIPNTQGMQINAFRITSNWDAKWGQQNGFLTNSERPTYHGEIADYAITDSQAAYANGLLEFDITSVAQQWADGEPNYGIMLKANDVQSGNIVGLLDSDHAAYDSYNPQSNNTPYMDPTFIINYRDAKGMEPQWTYTSMSGGRSATAYVNNYNGELTVINTDAGVDGNRLPLSVYHVYNDSTKSWKTNYELFMMHETTSADLKQNYPYYLTDMDGTDHYFYEKNGKYVDEDGLGYTLEVVREYDVLYRVKDKDGGQMNFNWNGQLYYIINSVGNHNYVNWTDGFTKIDRITDGAARVYQFNYTGNYISSIQAPDGTVSFGLGTSGRLESVTYPGDTNASTIITYNYRNQPIRITGLDGCYVEIVYTSTEPYRVEKMAYKNNLDAELKSYSFTYHHNMTIITDKDNQKVYYHFNSAGQTVGVVDQSTGMGQYYEFGMPGQTGTTHGTENKMLSSTQLQNSVDNYIVNPSFNAGGGFSQYISFSVCNITETYCTGGVDGSNDSGDSIGHYMSFRRDSPGGMHMIYYQVPTLPCEGWYTFSMYYNTDGTTLTNGGAYLRIIDYKADGSDATLHLSERMIKSDSPETDGWERVSVSFYYTGYEVHAELIFPYDSCGQLSADCFQLEPGAVANPYNLLENSNLDRGASAWTYSDTPTISTEYDYPSRGNGQNTIKIYGNARTKQEVTQHVIVKGNAGDVFNFGGWGWVESVGTSKYSENATNKPTAGIKITYGDSRREVYLPFNSSYWRWQMAGDTFILEEDTDYIDFTFTYSYNVNRGYLTRAYLYKEQYGQTYDYDASGNVISTVDEAQSQATFAYNNNNLAKLLNPTGSRYFYSYHENTKVLNYALSTSGQQMKFTYDDYGNPVTSEIKPATFERYVQAKSYYIINAHSGNALDASGDNYTVVNKNWIPGNTDQMWTIIGTSTPGVYEVESVKYPGRMLDVTDPNSEAGVGELMETWPSNHAAAQRFRNRLNKDGTLTILSRVAETTTCIDGQPGNSTDTSNGTSIKREYLVDGKESQNWYFVEVEENTIDKIMRSTATYTWDGNYQSSVTDSLGNTTAYNTNLVNGLLNSITDANDHTTDYTYDAKNRLQKVQNGSSYVEYGYDTADRLSSIMYNNGQGQYSFGYDSFSRPSNIKVGNRTLSTYTYNNQNLLSVLSYGNGATLHYDYDNNLDTLRSKWYNSDTTKSVQYFYDMQGRLALTKDMFANTSSQIIYDMAGREVEYIQRTDWNNSDGAEQVRLYNKYENKTNRIIRQDISVLGNKLSTSINYGNGELGQVIDFVYDVTGTLNGTNVYGLNYVYDNLGRMTSRQISGGITTTYGYVDGQDNTTSTLIESVDNGGDEWSYEYDNIGNITKVFRNGELRQSYEYDHLNQLTRVNDKDTDATYCYQYDLGGNILQKSTYSYTTGEITTTANDIIIYQYGDTDWKDLLTGYDGQTFTYDNIGNPLTYRDGMTMTWQYGRQLASISRSGLSATFEYNGDGIRTSKTVNGIETIYYVDANGTILAEDKGGTMIQYLFDESGTRIGLVVNNSSYFYDFNVQGDIIALRDASGNKIATYIYDAWGKLIRVTDATGNEITSTSHVANMNSFRYRGYYYDAETGFYYVSSRYYDPEIGRFISPDTTDVLTATPMGLTDKNLFAYCDNNPVVRADHGGEFWHVVAGAAIGGLIGGISSIVGQAISGQKIDWAEVGVSAASGALTGAITAACPGMGALATGLVHGAVGAGTYAATELINGRTPTVAGTLTVGVTSGLLAGGTKAISQFASSKYLEKIVKQPQRIQGQSLGKVKYAAELSPQWKTGTLTKGTHSGMGWKATAHGDWLIQWHPGSKWHYGGAPYWKVSSGINGTLRFPY